MLSQQKQNHRVARQNNERQVIRMHVKENMNSIKRKVMTRPHNKTGNTRMTQLVGSCHYKSYRIDQLIRIWQQVLSQTSTPHPSGYTGHMTPHIQSAEMRSTASDQHVFLNCVCWRQTCHFSTHWVVLLNVESGCCRVFFSPALWGRMGSQRMRVSP